MFARRAIAPIVIALAIALAYAPGLDGFWTRDDYMQLAFARLVGSPWPIFVHDHYFPAPGSIFRPLGFASFWLSQALFGTDYFANACGDMLLHIAVAVAFYRVVRFAWSDRVPAAICALLFAVHPAVLGTALWWSARFDLLAMLFGLVAVRAGLDYAQRPRSGSLTVALLAALAALLSKETALAAVAAIGCVWLRAFWVDAACRRFALQALTGLAAVTAFFFAWRTMVLGTATTGLIGDGSLVDGVLGGLQAWLAHVADYAWFWPRTNVVLRASLIAAGLLGITAIWFGRGGVTLGLGKQEALVPYSSSAIDLLICGACFFVLPAILQAPVAALNAAPLHAGVSAVEAAMRSRLYYVSFGGLVILLASFIARLWPDARMPRALLAIALVVPVLVFGWISRRTASEFAAQTAASRALAESIAKAVDRTAATIDARCRIVVLGIVPPPEWGDYVSMDSIAKALTLDPDRVDRCFVEADFVTYFNLMRGDANRADAAPYVPRALNGRPLSWLRVGDLTAAYLDPPAATDAASLAGIVFLRYEDGAFVDVTSDVASGRMPVVLR